MAQLQEVINGKKPKPTKPRYSVSNSCKTKRGCDTDRLTLPYMRKRVYVSGKMHGKWHGLQKIQTTTITHMDETLAQVC